MNTRTNTQRNAANNELNLDALLKSNEFDNIVAKLVSTHGFTKYTNKTLYDDVRQVCAIAVVDAAAIYNPELVGGNFWGYAYKRMYEYAKNEVHEQRNLVHIPYNRRVDSERYSRITHEYADIVRPDNHENNEVMYEEEYFEAQQNNAGISLDIKNALDRLSEQERTVFELKHGLKNYGNGKENTFNDISELTGMNIVKIRKLYNSALKSMQAYLA